MMNKFYLITVLLFFSICVSLKAQCHIEVLDVEIKDQRIFFTLKNLEDSALVIHVSLLIGSSYSERPIDDKTVYFYLEPIVMRDDDTLLVEAVGEPQFSKCGPKPDFYLDGDPPRKIEIRVNSGEKLLVGFYSPVKIKRTSFFLVKLMLNNGCEVFVTLPRGRPGKLRKILRDKF